MAKGPGEKGSLWFPCSCELGVGDQYKQEQRIPEGGHRSLLQGLSPLVLRNPNPKMASLNLMPHSARTTYLLHMAERVSRTSQPLPCPHGTSALCVNTTRVLVGSTT